MKTILFLALLLVAGTAPQTAHAQKAIPSTPELRVSLKYNTEADRYEVFAEANFTDDHFLLGASQISVVVPKSVADQSFYVVGTTGRWTDYSDVYAPAAAPDYDFHGLNTMGKSIEVQPDVPVMLFAFNLQGGYVDGVRLFVNNEDPTSKHRGMMGGDFANTLLNHKGAEFYRPGLAQADLARLTTETSSGADQPSLMVYPNPVTGDVVAITARQFAAGERLRLRLFSATGVEISSLEEDAARLVNYQLRLPVQLVGRGAAPQVYLYAERMVPTTSRRTFCQKLLIQN